MEVDLHVKDYWDDYSWLFALTQKEARQVANKISFLFIAFGPPKILQSNKNSKFCGKVVELLTQK